jgi:hypothetical protein
MDLHVGRTISRLGNLAYLVLAFYPAANGRLAAKNSDNALMLSDKDPTEGSV